METNFFHAANGITPCYTLESATVVPNVSGKPYVLQSLCGEIIYIPCSKSATRFLVTGRETDGAFAVIGTGGVEAEPIGFHYHNTAHDVFLCLKGAVTVWANGQCRTLGPGDLASVPPKVVHSYQILGPYTEFIGLIVPGGWEEFFRFIGEPYGGPLFPVEDDRNPVEVLLPKLRRAAEEFDMVPVPMHKRSDPSTWVDRLDSVLPGRLEPYYLRARSGPKYLIGGVVCSPMVSTLESAGRFEIGAIEGTAWHQGGVLERNIRFAEVHHAIQVADGAVEFALDGGRQMSTLGQGETIYIPKGISFTMRITSRYAKVYVFCSGNGLVRLLSQAGEPYKSQLPPERAAEWDEAKITVWQEEFNFQLSS